MAADCAVELRKHNVAHVSIWPGPVITEHVDDMLKASQNVITGSPSILSVSFYLKQE